MDTETEKEDGGWAEWEKEKVEWEKEKEKHPIGAPRLLRAPPAGRLREEHLQIKKEKEKRWLR